MGKLEDIEADDYYDMGCQWRIEREWDKAITCFRHAIDLNRNFIYAYIDLAAVYAKKGNFHDAVLTLRKALKIDPDFDLLYYNLAKYQYRHGETAAALNSIDEAIECNSTELYERVRRVILRNII